MLCRLVSGMGSRPICWVSVAARFALPTQIINADLARLKAVEEWLEVGNANGEDGETLYQLNGNGGFPHGEGEIVGRKGFVGVIDLNGDGGHNAVRWLAFKLTR